MRCAHLNGVSQARACAMHFQDAHILGRHLPLGQGRPDDLLLRGAIGGLHIATHVATFHTRGHRRQAAVNLIWR